MGTFRGVYEDGGSGTNSLSKVLPSGGPFGASLWDGNLGFDGNDAKKTLGSTRGFLEKGGRDDGSKAGG